jgi:hypothetical protein
LRPKEGETGEAVHARHVEVEQHGVGFGFAAERVLRLRQRARGLDARAIERLRQHGSQRIAHHRVVVGDQESQHAGTGATLAAAHKAYPYDLGRIAALKQ